MTFEGWYVVVGVLLLVLALSSGLVKRLPLSTSMLYLGAGLLLGLAGVARIDPVAHAALLERVTEIAVIVSLFTAGLKLRVPLRDELWRPPILLAFVAMALTVGLIATIGVLGLGLPLGAAVLLGAVLAPTDPVLASDVQLVNARDNERLRFTLTAEAGLNDGTAFPFVMLGLGLLGAHDLGELGSRWLAVDVLWRLGAGLGIGTLLGAAVARVALALRRRHGQAVGLDDFLALGLIAGSYGVAHLIHAWGFLAVFAAGLAMRRLERQANPTDIRAEGPVADPGDEPRDDATTAVVMTEEVLAFNEQIERIGELTMVLLIGIMLASMRWTAQAWWFVPLLLLGVRPLAVVLTLIRSRTSRVQRMLASFFGIRGIGSLYYLMYGIEHGLPEQHAELLSSLTLTAVAVSIVVHGTTVTPLMRWYGVRQESYGVRQEPSGVGQEGARRRP